MDLTDAVLNLWKTDVNEQYGVSKYLHRDRAEIMESLAELLKSRGVSLEEALALKREVKQFMITTKGHTKKDPKHKGWEDAVATDFDAAVLRVYPPDPAPEAPINAIKQSLVPSKAEYGSTGYLTKNAIITAWAQDRYGSAWTERLNLEIHKYNGKFIEEFNREVMDSSWVRTGIDQPKWYFDIMGS